MRRLFESHVGYSLGSRSGGFGGGGSNSGDVIPMAAMAYWCGCARSNISSDSPTYSSTHAWTNASANASANTCSDVSADESTHTSSDAGTYAPANSRANVTAHAFSHNSADASAYSASDTRVHPSDVLGLVPLSKIAGYNLDNNLNNRIWLSSRGRGQQQNAWR